MFLCWEHVLQTSRESCVAGLNSADSVLYYSAAAGTHNTLSAAFAIGSHLYLTS